jgi:hypothetical protein
MRTPNFPSPSDTLDKPLEPRLPYKPALDNPWVDHFTTGHTPPGSQPMRALIIFHIDIVIHDHKALAAMAFHEVLQSRMKSYGQNTIRYIHSI